MAKRNNVNNRKRDKATTLEVSGSITTDALEGRLVAFADELGRIAGTVQARAEGWMDRETRAKRASRPTAAMPTAKLVKARRRRGPR